MQVGRIACFTSSRWPVEKLLLRRPLYCQQCLCAKIWSALLCGSETVCKYMCKQFRIRLISLTILNNHFTLGNKKQYTIFCWHLLDITSFLWQYCLGQIIAYSQPATPNHIYLIKRAQYLRVNCCDDNSWLIYSAYQVLLRQSITAAEPVWHRETRCRYMRPSSSTRYADMSPLVLPPAWWQYRRSRLIIRMITICHQC